MSTQPAFSTGRIDITEIRVPRLQLGGKRPPFDGGKYRLRARGRSHAPARRHRNLRWCGAGLCALGSTLGITPAAQAASPPDLSGVYHCEGNSEACNQYGSIFTVTQSGSQLQIKSDKGQTATAKLTSDATLTAGPVWNNMHAIIRSSERSVIVWANGAAWRKQQITATN